MFVITKLGNNGNTIARIPEGAYRGTICLFTEPTEVGVNIDVMITGAKFVNGEPTCFFVRKITDVDNDRLVRHSGFVCAGPMCCTTAQVDRERHITPGRLNNLLYEADFASGAYKGCLPPKFACTAFVDSENRVYGVYSTESLRREVEQTKEYQSWLNEFEAQRYKRETSCES